MNVCPGCGQSVRPVWPTCRACGTLLMTAPAPVAPIGAAVAVAGPSADEQFFAPAVLQPKVQMPSMPEPPAYTHSTRIAGSGGEMGKWFALVAMVVFLIAAFATMWFTFKPGASAQSQRPVVLEPRPPTAGLPTSLDAIVRIQAESSRRTALQTVEQLGNGEIAGLAAAQPDFTWIAGDRPSTDPRTVSVARSTGAVTIAVSGSSKDVCAFGQWSPGGTPMYVTMAHEPACSAVNAPGTGWSAEPGGAASDLPDNNG
jgi:hypothetical protein